MNGGQDKSEKFWLFFIVCFYYYSAGKQTQGTRKAHRNKFFCCQKRSERKQGGKLCCLNCWVEKCVIYRFSVFSLLLSSSASSLHLQTLKRRDRVHCKQLHWCFVFVTQHKYFENTSTSDGGSLNYRLHRQRFWDLLLIIHSLYGILRLKFFFFGRSKIDICRSGERSEVGVRKDNFYTYSCHSESLYCRSLLFDCLAVKTFYSFEVDKG